MSTTTMAAVAILAIAAVVPRAASAQERAVLSGVVSAIGGTVRLAGATVEVRDAAGRVARQTISDEQGHFLIEDLLPGRWTIAGRLDGFATLVKRDVDVAPGTGLRIDFDLEVAGIEQRVDVAAARPADAPLEIPDTAMSVEQIDGDTVDEAPLRGGGQLDALLSLLPGVVRGAGGRLAMNGGAESQTAFLVNGVRMNDPATGDFGTAVPADAVEAATVLANPYAAEYGRFTTGVAAIDTRAGTNEWRFRINSFLPRLRRRDGGIRGIERFTPRVSVSGPIVRDRLFFAHSVRYRRILTDVAERPSVDNDSRFTSYEAFTQLDAKVSARHSLTGTLFAFSNDVSLIGVDTFTLREAVPGLRQRGVAVSLIERAALPGSAALETIVAVRRIETGVHAQGQASLTLSPEVNGGAFFNEQSRRTSAMEIMETLTLPTGTWQGTHDVKVGVSVVHASFSGRSESRDVEIRRADGTLTQRLSFGAPAAPRAAATDAGVFVQDRWRVSRGRLLELGARVDWDGARRQLNLAPRAGVTMALDPDRRRAIRGGVGLFVSPTPLNVLAFEQFETPTVHYFDRGETAPRRVVPYAYTAEPGRTPSSLIWNIEYDHRIGRHVLLKVNHVQRAGRNQYIVDTEERGEAGVLVLSAAGRSRYRSLELTSRFAAAGQQVFVTYIRSIAEADLNGFDGLFGNVRNPVIRPNEYAVLSTDVPHRLQVRGSFAVKGWLLSPLVDVRQGFPYSVVDEDRRFVGPRNTGGRFPTLRTLDLGIQRRIKAFGLRARVGVRVFHLLGEFAPRDVQANTGSSRFGQFFNTMQRSFAMTLQLE